MRYFCQCGERLQPIKPPKDEKSKVAVISYKVFIVTTKLKYKCPNGCELKTVKY